ncbi:MAG: MFS transporter, partial [SAR202 cluster bacterium]|nr:MFS transporter [SAR202 cluster bacterium]
MTLEDLKRCPQNQSSHRWHRPRFSLHTFSAFQYRNYRFLWSSALWVAGGYWIQQVVVGWLIYDITNSAFLTSVAMGLEAIPILIGGPIGGFLVDVFDRRRLLITVCLYHGLCALALAIGLIFWEIGPLEIFTFTLLVGFSWVISEPARSAVVANTVPKGGLLNAFALITLGWGGARLAVPAIGGLLISIYGAHAALISESILMLTAALFAAGIRMDEKDREKPQLSKIINGLLEGALYVRNNRMILALLTFSFAPPLIIFPFVYGLLPVYAAEVFHVGPTGLGILVSASGIGMVFGTIVVASLGDL